MKLVDAKLSSAKEFANRMMDGEIFYREGWSYLYYCGEFLREHPQEFDTCPINLEKYGEMQVKAKWDENIEKPILCWVSDISGNEKDFAALIVEKCGGYYHIADGARWKYATPVTMSDLV